MTSTLRISSISVNSLGGAIGVTLCPGKKGISTLDGKPFDRGLDADLDVVAEWGASAVLTLMPQYELERYKVEALGDGVRARFMEWHHLSIEDMTAPDSTAEAAWPEVSRRLRALLAQGNRVLVHCRGGRGRAGTMAARLLVELGLHDPKSAISAVRSVREGAVEFPCQAHWVAEGKPLPAPAAHSTSHDRAVGALVGLAAGDAFGTTLEFSSKKPLATQFDMVGGGPFRLEPGQWTDDTAMALALADSLLVRDGFDPRDLMERFVDWRANGTYSSTGDCFDIGVTTSRALSRFISTGEPFSGSADAHTAGNGSIMRLAPVSVRFWSDRTKMVEIAEAQSRTTHAAPEAVRCCRILAEILADAISGIPLPEIVRRHADHVEGFAAGQGHREVRGTGYVVASLHAAFWAVARSSSFEDAIVLAANLGEDADTTAAVAGQIAGAVYGIEGIPRHWRNLVQEFGDVEGMARRLSSAAMQGHRILERSSGTRRGDPNTAPSILATTGA